VGPFEWRWRWAWMAGCHALARRGQESPPTCSAIRMRIARGSTREHTCVSRDGGIPVDSGTATRWGCSEAPNLRLSTGSQRRSGSRLAEGHHVATPQAPSTRAVGGRMLGERFGARCVGLSQRTVRDEVRASNISSPASDTATARNATCGLRCRRVAPPPALGYGRSTIAGRTHPRGDMPRRRPSQLRAKARLLAQRRHHFEGRRSVRRPVRAGPSCGAPVRASGSSDARIDPRRVVGLDTCRCCGRTVRDQLRTFRSVAASAGPWLSARH
jgi:hypothetical protein